MLRKAIDWKQKLGAHCEANSIAPEACLSQNLDALAYSRYYRLTA